MQSISVPSPKDNPVIFRDKQNVQPPTRWWQGAWLGRIVCTAVYEVSSQQQNQINLPPDSPPQTLQPILLKSRKVFVMVVWDNRFFQLVMLQSSKKKNSWCVCGVLNGTKSSAVEITPATKLFPSGSCFIELQKCTGMFRKTKEK